MEKFGGGGHKFASGVRNEDKKEIDKLLVALSETCKEFKEQSEEK